MVISMLAGRTGATDKYFTIYDNVGGVKFGTQVFYEGYQIGQVENIQPIDKGNNQLQFKVDIAVEEGWKIPEDSIARAMISGLLSAVAIDIRAGKSATLLKPGAQIRGSSPTNMFAALQDISSQFGDLSANSIKPLLDNLNKYVQVLGDSTVAHLPQAMADLEKIAGSVQRMTHTVETDLLKPANRAHIDTILANFDKTSTNLAAVSDGLEETRKTLTASITKVNGVIDDNAGNVSEAARDLRYTLDTIARYVDDISHNADATARNMAEFSRAIRDNPGLFITGSGQSDQAKGGKK
ncbi:MAG: MlaD family protein [Rhodospirillaceae bacterium]|nr:MlaD family protein [Rhodospirillaceae bacterium]